MVSDAVIDAFIQKHVKDGQVLSIGADKNGERVLARLGVQKEARDWDIQVVPTCARFAALCATYNIPITSLNDAEVDAAVEFASQVDANHNFVKKDSWSLLRDKMIAQSAGELFVIATKESSVKHIGGTIPVEISAFGHKHTLLALQKMGPATLREHAGKPFLTETGNYLADVSPQSVFSLDDFEFSAQSTAGVVETGLFVGLADRILTYDRDQITVKSRVREKEE